MATKIKNIDDLAQALGYTSAGELAKHLSLEVYPVTIEHDEKALKLVTDADRVPFSKILRFPFTEDDFDNALSGLQCVTDYAMHEGYDRTHEDLFKILALRYAEKHGIYEYKVNKSFMEYWSLYDKGFYFYRIDLNTDERTEVCLLPWSKDEDFPVPAFLRSEVEGFTKYNYFCG